MGERPSASRWPKAISSLPTSPPFFILYCCPNREVRAALDLQRRGFAVYLPSTTERHSRFRDRTYERPIFSRYLFCRFDYNERWRVLATPGIAEIVRVGEEPATLTDAEVNEVRALEARLRAPAPRARTGEIVEIRVGRVTLRGAVSGRGVLLRTLRTAA